MDPAGSDDPYSICWLTSGMDPTGSDDPYSIAGLQVAWIPLDPTTSTASRGLQVAWILLDPVYCMSLVIRKDPDPSRILRLNCPDPSLFVALCSISHAEGSYPVTLIIILQLGWVRILLDGVAPSVWYRSNQPRGVLEFYGGGGGHTVRALV